MAKGLYKSNIGKFSSEAKDRTSLKNEQVKKEIKSLKKPSMNKTVFVESPDGKLVAEITRVNPGYALKSGSNEMYTVAVNTKNGDEVFRTNRRGSSAFSEAKDDVLIRFGLYK